MINYQTHICIGVPTYKRPFSIVRLLKSIKKADIPNESKLSIIVIDNDPECSGINILKDMNLDNLSVYSVKERGISSARNAILEIAFTEVSADYLLMVDDDEVVSKEWIVEMLKTQRSTEASIVGGLKIPIFENPPEKWMPTSDVFFYSPSHSEGTAKRLVSTDNLLITRDFFIHYGAPKFDLNFSTTGGGDTEYLERIKKMGACFAFSVKGLTYEVVPISRMSLNWAKKRSYRIGIGLGRISMIHDNTLFKVLSHWLKLIMIITASFCLTTILTFSPNSRIKYQLLLIKQIGKIHGHQGKRVYPYE